MNASPEKSASGIAAALIAVFSSVNALHATGFDDLIATAWTRAEQRSEATVSWLVANNYPSGPYNYYPQTGNVSTGKWNVTPSTADWRAGFWPGTLWLLAQKTGDDLWRQRAIAWSAALANSTNSDHDIGFIALGSLGKGHLYHDDINDPLGTYRLFARTGLSTAAAKLDSRFDMPAVPLGPPIPTGFTRSWGSWFVNPYPVCIDNMMNIEVMFQAYELNGRLPSQRVWFDHALTHARSSIAKLMRPDGSTYHVVCHFESGPQAGQVERKTTHQGYSDETTWSRGQAWAIYGFTAAYRHARRDPATNAADLLAAACVTADYFIDHLPHHHTADIHNHQPGDFVPPSDFDASLGEPVGPWNDANNDYNSATGTGLGDRKPATGAATQRDSSAAAVAASGLIELSALVASAAERDRYLGAAEDILRCLITYDGPDPGSEPDYLCSAAETAHPGILKGASERWSHPYNSLIYGDYYFLEALARYEALQAREQLARSQHVRVLGSNTEFAFEINSSIPALGFRIQKADSLDPQGWTTLTSRTGAGAWSGVATVEEESLPDARCRVIVTDPNPGPRGFFRILTRSVGGGP
jgi:hypothetical protein